MEFLTVREALREALLEEMDRDSKVFLMGEEVGEYQGAYKISQGLLERFGPERVIDTPISEHGFTGIAIGGSFRGLRPVVEFMSFNFAMQAIDHIINSAAKTHYMSGGLLSCPIVFRGPNGAAARVGAQHSQCYGSWYAHCPGLKVVAPFDALSAKLLLKASIKDPDPVIFLENEMLYGNSFPVKSEASLSGTFYENAPELLDPEHYAIGQAAVLRKGSHVTLVAFSLMVDFSLRAAEILAAEDGIQVEVIDLRTLRPLDKKTIIKSLQKTHRLLTVEEGWPFAGIGSEISAMIQEEAFDELDGPIVRVTGVDVPLPYAPSLENLALPRVQTILDKVRQSFKI